jgi:hypothetical protein
MGVATDGHEPHVAKTVPVVEDEADAVLFPRLTTTCTSPVRFLGASPEAFRRHPRWAARTVPTGSGLDSPVPRVYLEPLAGEARGRFAPALPAS